MKLALLLSWAFFAVFTGWRAIAADVVVMKDGFGQMFMVETENSRPANRKFSVHLDDAEIARIRDACK